MEEIKRRRLQLEQRLAQQAQVPWEKRSENGNNAGMETIQNRISELKEKTAKRFVSFFIFVICSC